MGEFQFNAKKLDESILFFVQHANNEHLGKTKMMKLLYYADFDSFERFGEPITGATYLRLDQGPVPRQGRDALDFLAMKHKIVIEPMPSGDFERDAYRLGVEPEYSNLTPRDIEVLRAVADEWKGHSLRQIVKATHSEAPWLAVLPNREIPYSLALYRNRFGELDLDSDELDEVSDDGYDDPE